MQALVDEPAACVRSAVSWGSWGMLSEPSQGARLVWLALALQVTVGQSVPCCASVLVDETAVAERHTKGAASVVGLNAGVRSTARVTASTCPPRFAHRPCASTRLRAEAISPRWTRDGFAWVFVSEGGHDHYAHGLYLRERIQLG